MLYLHAVRLHTLEMLVHCSCVLSSVHHSERESDLSPFSYDREIMVLIFFIQFYLFA